LWGIEDDHRPTWAGEIAIVARVLLNPFDFLDRRVERRRHRFVHHVGLVSFDENRRPNTL